MKVGTMEQMMELLMEESLVDQSVIQLVEL